MSDKESLEAIEKVLHKTSNVMAVISVAVWASIALFSVVLVAVSGIAGAGIAFIVYIVALLVWGKVTKDWLSERKSLAEKLISARESPATMSEEMRKLRESIESLRRSLES